ncbi:hypothetical protein BH10PAT3_BH10PAT3_4410 [soil metagenome]
MFKLDNDFLQSLGLGGLPVDEKNRLLQMIYERLEMNVGMRLAEKMSDQQLDEFEGFIDRNDEAGALKWLESNFPNYKDVVAEELEKLKGEVQAAAPQILSAQGGSGQAMPAIAQEPMMPGIAPPQHFDAARVQQPAPQPQPYSQPLQPQQPMQAQPQQAPQPAQPFFGPAAPATQPLQPYTPSSADPQPFGPPLQAGFAPQPQAMPQVPLPQQPMPQFGQPYMPPSADEPAQQPPIPQQPMPQQPPFTQPAQPQQFTPPPGFTPGQ